MSLSFPPELEHEARRVLALPTMQPGTVFPFFLQQQHQVAEFARRVADAVLGTSTPPLRLEPRPDEDPRPADQPELPAGGRVLFVTRIQLDALLEMPEDWFAPRQLRRGGADALCRRLVAKGVLEARPAGSNTRAGAGWEGEPLAADAQQHYRKVPGLRYEVGASRRRGR